MQRDQGILKATFDVIRVVENYGSRKTSFKKMAQVSYFVNAKL